MTIDLRGKKALVTGSVAGIGRAISEALAEAGAEIVAHGLTDVPEVAKEWRARGFTVAESEADLSQADGANRLVRDLRNWGSPDILVLSASIEVLQAWDQADLSAMTLQSMVNVHASLLLLQACVPHMVATGWGRVLALGSAQEERPNPSHIVYAATKAAQSNIVLNMARNLRAPGVTFNILKPGAIETDRNRAKLTDPASRQSILERIPLGRVGVPADCAAAALLLCSDAADYINGAELAVDGGLRL